MEIFKSVTKMFLSKSVSILFLINSALDLNAQINDNNTSQTKSPNANIQIGNNNLNKQDNRKYITSKETKNIDNYNAPLITGNNPFVTINNIFPNKDSIKYEFELKKKIIRETLSDFMWEGYNLKNRCGTDTSFGNIHTETMVWVNKVFNYLYISLDRSYARQFDLAEMSTPMILQNKSEEFSNLWRFIVAKKDKLDLFITSLY